MSRRSFLFLQGAPSFFGYDLALALEEYGHTIFRINLCLGDRLYWPRFRDCYNYRGALEDWRAYLTAFIARHAITDILYYADRLPYHVVAADVARTAGVRAIAIEFGYMRPDWITLEYGGMSAYSHFPSDPRAILELARTLPDPSRATRYPYPHALEATCEVIFNLSSYFGWFLYPRYDADRIYNPLVEYISHLPRIAMTYRNTRRARVILDRLIQSGAPYYLFPLQIDADYQLRANCAFVDQAEIVETVIRSFARHAPAGTALLFKQHPLDNALTQWKARIRLLARQYGISERVRFVRAGELHLQLAHARGTVLTNSTVGIHALLGGHAVKVLGVALYDIPGVTFQGSLDDFWSTPETPDRELATAFLRLLAASTQVRGNFYTRKGRKAAASEAARRLDAGLVNEPGAYVPIPPRLERARRIGVLPADEFGRQIPQRGPVIASEERTHVDPPRSGAHGER